MGRPKRTSTSAFRTHDETKLEALRAGAVKTLERHKHHFTRLCAKDSCLAPITSLDELLAPWLGDRVTNAVRAQRFLSILREYQRTGHALWSDALFIAAFPMIIATRRRLTLPSELRDDGDALVMEAFYREAKRVRVTDVGALGVLGRAMARTVFRMVRDARQGRATEEAYVQELAPFVTTPDLDTAIDLKRALDLRTEEQGLTASMTALRVLRLPGAERDRRYALLRKRRTRARSRFWRLFSIAA